VLLGSELCKAARKTLVKLTPEYNKIAYGSNGQSIPGGPMEQLLRAIAPNCSQLILQCNIGKAIFSGYDCCAKYFDPIPYFTDGGKTFTENSYLVKNPLT